MEYLLVLLLLYLQFVQAIPKFNTVNSQYYNGTQCPSVVQHNVACPVLCVNDLSLCPESVGANSCPSGQSLCIDGTCQSQCSLDLKNPCSCRSSQLVACHHFIKTDIFNYHPENATAQTYEACSLAMDMNPKISMTWDDKLDQAQNNIVWNVCNAPIGISFPVKVPLIIAYLSAHLGFILLWPLWILYKHTREKKQRRTSTENTVIDDQVTNETINEKSVIQVMETSSESLKQSGFRVDWIGLFMIGYMACLSIFWILVLLILSLDYYGYVNGTPFGLFYDSYDLSSKAFCLAWFLATSWYLAINVMRSKILNHFRIRTDFARSDYVQIQKPRKVVQISGNDGMVQRLAVLENFLRQLLGFDTLTRTVPVQVDSQGKRYFEFQSKRYTLDLDQCQFVPARIRMSLRPEDLVKKDQGLDSPTAQRRLEKIGPNFIKVQVPNFFEAFWQEITGFFYVYQLMILWCYFYLAYWQIGISDTGVILLAAVIKVIVRLKSENRIKKMAEHVDHCLVLRDKEWQSISTADLVPGDVVQILTNLVIPADMVVLKGDIVVDESSLTGEALPIRKFPLRSTGPFETDFGKMNSLFAGSTVKQALHLDEPASALVLKTRTDTDKGQLVQRILFPQPVSFIFNEQLKLVFCMLLMWAIVLLVFGTWWLGGTGMTAWFYGTICAAQVMNPLLPAILVVGQSIASKRLRKLQVYCVDLPRILMAGKVQVFCFDKTGTLTKEGLDYFGVFPIKNNIIHAYTVVFDAFPPLLKLGLSCCHSVTQIDRKNIGNPVDVTLFEISRTMLTADGMITSDNKHYKLLQRFEFQHARATMSVVVKDLATRHVHVFCKGSFERIAELTPNLPADYFKLATEKAREGCYVLAIAHRDLGILKSNAERELIEKSTRDEVERNLYPVGILLLKNQLRQDTSEAIEQLRDGNVRSVMITGDNAWTGVYVGQRCSLLTEKAPTILGDMVINEATGKNTVQWTNVETQQPVKNVDAEILANSQAELAVTGNAFRWLVDQNRIRDYLFNIRIFARMTPIDKMNCVELFMEKTITAMCGDGGNDCGALRAAHVGIAMSETEASVVSPFSTSRRSIMACVDLLIQGRSALATSFASYKYLIMYGETMAMVKFCTFYYTMSFSQWNFILIDAFITVFCAFAVTQPDAAKRLSKHRPTARILGSEVLLSVLGQLWINAWFLIGAFIWLYTKDDFFRCREWDARAIDNSKWWLLGDSFEADILTFIALYQFINSAFVFNYGYVFRQRWYRNYLLVGIWALFIAIVSYWELADPNAFGCLMRVNCGNPDVLVSLGYPRPNFYIEPYNNPLGHNVLPRYFRYQLWAYSICNMIVANIWERVFVLGPVRKWLRKQYPMSKTGMNL